MKRIVPTIYLCLSVLFFSSASAQGNGNSSDRMFFNSRLYAQNGNIADANLVVFDDDFSNGYDVWDALKMMNPGENFGLRRDGRILAIEARNTLCATDTIYFDIRNLAQQTYKIKFEPQFMSTVTLLAVLKDNFTGGSTPINLADSSNFSFTITSNPASKAADRFKIVFLSSFNSGGSSSSTLPLKFTQESLKQSSNTVHLNWSVAEEMNVKHYQVERSNNGTSFKPVGIVPASGSSNGKADYQYQDMNSNTTDIFYRITGVDIDGKLTHSRVLKMSGTSLQAQLSIWPNPLTTPQLQLRITGAEKGICYVAVTNQLGQPVYNNKLTISSDNQQSSLTLGSNLAKGRYTVTLTRNDGSILQQSLLVQ